jgi:hypothetical protein
LARPPMDDNCRAYVLHKLTLPKLIPSGRNTAARHNGSGARAY